MKYTTVLFLNNKNVELTYLRHNNYPLFATTSATLKKIFWK